MLNNPCKYVLPNVFMHSSTSKQNVCEKLRKAKDMLDIFLIFTHKYTITNHILKELHSRQSVN